MRFDFERALKTALRRLLTFLPVHMLARPCKRSSGRPGSSVALVEARPRMLSTT